MATMKEHPEMHSFAARLNTFQTAHQISKRRASSQTSSKKKETGAVEWPHQRPAGDDLARAGFFYRPAQDSPDNVQCFLCAVKLDGWEAEDDPLKEHLAHSAKCHWALSLHTGISAQSSEEEDVDPMSDELVAARRGTFEAAAGWPHESKRGWKCKITKMVEAGWCLDPAPAQEDEDADGVTCFYCHLSLDGWEPKDDPFEEHRRRSPDCAFFVLVEKHSADGNKKGKKAGKKGGRTSTASKTSRLSTHSVLSTFSEPPSLADVGQVEHVEAEVDDSVVTNASQATAKGKKKGGRPKAAAKGAKGRKRANTVDSEVDAEPLYPDLTSPTQEEEEIVASSQPVQDEAPAPPPAGKRTRKNTAQSKPQLDSSVVEISSMDVAPAAKKSTRGRKPKAQPEPEPEPTVEVEVEAEPEPGPEANLRDSQVSAQLQDELERSIDIVIDAHRMSEDATPQPEPTKPKRGVKRTSDGLRKKAQVEEDANSVMVEFPVPPKAAPAATKGKRGRKPSKQPVEENEAEAVAPTQDVSMSEAEPEPAKGGKGKKGAPKKATKGRKASSTRSSRSTVTAENASERDNEAEDLDRDEREIEAELQRIAAEQAAIATEQDRTAEFEASPSSSHKQKHVDEIRHLEEELQVEVNALTKPGENMTAYVAAVAAQTPEKEAASPSGSDKENNPSSIKQPPNQAAAAPILSPTKTSRIPLAPGTPNRSHISPSKRAHFLSPSKQFKQLTSSHPWEAIDMDSILLVDQENAENYQLVGALTSPEKGLTVEEWVKWQAGRGEEKLRSRCEEMVTVLEREGLRALEALHGVGVVDG